MHAASTSRRVGAATIVVLGLAVSAVLALSGQVIGPGRTIFVDFEQIGDLQVGSRLKIGGQDAGVVRAVRFTSQGLVRTEVFVRSRFARHVHRNSELYINAKGIIGERFLEVGPPRSGDPGPDVQPGEVLRGIEPARLDRMLQTTYVNLKQITDLLREVAPMMTEFLSLADAIDRRLRAVEGEPGRLRRTYERGRDAALETAAVLRAVRAGTEDFDRVRRLARDVDALADRTGPELTRLGRQADQASAAVERLEAIFTPAERERLRAAFDRFRAAARLGEALNRDIETLAIRTAAGKGTVGALMNDLEIWDDIKVMHKIMKEKPWRVMLKPLSPKPE